MQLLRYLVFDIRFVHKAGISHFMGTQSDSFYALIFHLVSWTNI